MFRNLRRVAVAGSLALTAAGIAVPALASSPTASTPRPTVVLVHGAFADSSGWNGVIERLRKDGYPVRAASNPLRGLTSDSTYLTDLLHSISGPIILVGHSYGGAVITDAATGNADVKALVYVAGYAPDAGETLRDLNSRQVEHPIPALPVQAVKITEPDGSTGADIYLDPAQFRQAFAADVDRTTAADMAVTQRPADAKALTQASTTPAWKSIPSWYLVATQDHAIAPDLERFMAKRAGAHTVEVASSHAAMVSHPDAVTRLIERAAR